MIFLDPVICICFSHGVYLGSKRHRPSLTVFSTRSHHRKPVVAKPRRHSLLSVGSTPPPKMPITTRIFLYLFRFGNPELNLYLWLLLGVGGRSKLLDRGNKNGLADGLSHRKGPPELGSKELYWKVVLFQAINEMQSNGKYVSSRLVSCTVHPQFWENDGGWISPSQCHPKPPLPPRNCPRASSQSVVIITPATPGLVVYRNSRLKSGYNDWLGEDDAKWSQIAPFFPHVNHSEYRVRVTTKSWRSQDRSSLST